jgi:hypothetical protein
LCCVGGGSISAPSRLAFATIVFKIVFPPHLRPRGNMFAIHDCYLDVPGVIPVDPGAGMNHLAFLR